MTSAPSTTRPLLGEFAGIAEQVQEDLAQAHRVGADHRQALGQLEMPGHLRAGGLIRQVVEGFGQHRERIHQLQREIQFVDLGARQVEQVVDDAQLVLGIALDVAQVGEQTGGESLIRAGGLQGVAGVAQDDVERGAHLVADVRQQAGLDAVGLLGGQARLLDLLEEEGALQGAAQVAAQQFVDFAVVRAELEDGKADRLFLEVERFHHQAVAPVTRQQVGRHDLAGREAPAVRVEGDPSPSL